MSTMKTYNLEPIAIVGIGCRFPGCETPQEFWGTLEEGKDMTTDVPPDRFNLDKFGSEVKDRGKTFSRRGGFIQNVRDFDAPFFNLSPKEASQLDPQIRLLLESSWNAIEDAGMIINDNNRDCCVYIGHMTQDYLDIQCRNPSTLTSHAMQGNAITMAANRISFFLDIHGPSAVVDTACSSSLVALSNAIDDLRLGRCSWGLAGGCSALLDSTYFVGFTDWGILSPDGKCFTFDSRGNGYVRGEGAAMLVLKRLSDAEKDGDHIYALIDHLGVNHDGKKRAITSPNEEAHVDLMTRIYTEANIDVKTVDYVECHGTGTAVGDVTETSALKRVLCPNDRERPLVIGSVKTNFGHLEGCAGIIGVIKASMCLYKNLIPKSLNFDSPNPKILFDEWKLRVPTRLEHWPKKTGNKRASVNSFGIGGTNSHVILRNYESNNNNIIKSNIVPPFYYLVLNAKRGDLFNKLAKNIQKIWNDNIKDINKLNDICYTLMFKRHQLSHRMSIVGNAETVNDILKEVAQNGESKRAQVSLSLESGARKVAFVFCGQGAQWNNMGMDLYEKYPIYKDTLDKCCSVVDKIAGWSLLDKIKSEEVNGTRISQPATTAIQIALIELYKSWGIKTHANIGHSSGEIAAVYATGCITLEDAMKLAYYRGSTITDYAPTNGCMAAIAMTGEEAEKVCETVDGVRVACYNSPSSITISGDDTGINKLEKKFSETGQFFRKLKVTHAFHSHHMEKAMIYYRKEIENIIPKSELQSKFYSSLRKTNITDGSIFTCDYFVENLTHPVSFYQALQLLINENPDIALLEVGPHGALHGPILQSISDKSLNSRLLSCLTRSKDGILCTYEVISGLHSNGVEIDNNGLLEFIPKANFYAHLPVYPYARQELWCESEQSRRTRMDPPRGKLLGNLLSTPIPTYETVISLNQFPYLKDHYIMGTILAPGAMYLEMAMAAACDSFRSTEVTLYNSKFLQALVLKPDDPFQLTTTVNLQTGEIIISHVIYTDTSPDGYWNVYFRCFAKKEADTWCQEDIMDEIPIAEQRCKVKTDGSKMYPLLKESGLEFKDTFKTMKTLYQGVNEGFIDIDLKVTNDMLKGYVLHPTLIDVIFQSLISTIVTLKASYLPTSITMMSYQKSSFIPGKLRAYVKQKRCDSKLVGDVWIYSGGNPFLWAREVTLTNVEAPVDKQTLLKDTLSDIKYEEIDKINYNKFITNNNLHIGLLGNSNRKSSFIQKFKEVFNNNYDIIENNNDLKSKINNLSCLLYIADDDSLKINQPYDIKELLDFTHEILNLSIKIPLFILTIGTLCNCINSSSSTVIGFCRCLQSESPNIDTRIIDLDINNEIINCNCLSHVLAKYNNYDNEIIIRSGYVYSSRVVLREEISDIEKLPYPEHWRVDIDKPGLFDTFCIREYNHRPIKSNEVFVKLNYCGLNYKDVMLAMGLLKEEAFKNGLTQANLGLEGVGIALEVGSEITDIKVGDTVLCYLNEGIASYTISVKSFTFKIPNNIPPAQAAGFYVPYATAYACLVHKANIQPNEFVLIHGASGGVGSCAVQVAANKGCIVIATASTPEKKEYCLNLGATYVFDSRSLSFVQDILKVTEGRGCDVILNSLSDKMMTESVRLLAEYGRFVEIGKVDAINDNKLNIHDFLENGTYFFYDFDRYLLKRSDVTYNLGLELVKAIEENKLQPPPIKEFNIDKIGEAFRYLSQSKHIGKVVLKLRDNKNNLLPLNLPYHPKNFFLNEKTHLIMGARGLGLTIFQWIAQRGGRYFILLSKSGKLDDVGQLIVDIWRAKGCVVKIAGVDVSNQNELFNKLNDLLVGMPKLSGVINSTMFLQDMLIKNMDNEKFHLSCDPKSLGSYNMHIYEDKHDLVYDYFICFSSISSVIGNRGQSNYVSGNCYMESLMLLRHNNGKQGVVLNLGAIEDVGAISRNTDIVNSSLKTSMITSQQVLATLTHIFENPSEKQIIVNVYGEGIMAQIKGSNKFKYLSFNKNKTKSSDKNDKSGDSLLNQAKLSKGDEQKKIVELSIKKIIGKLLGLDSNILRNDQVLSAIGIDSIVSVELSNWIKDQYSLNISVFELTSGKTIIGLIDQIIESFAAVDEENKAEENNDNNDISSSHLYTMEYIMKRKPVDTDTLTDENIIIEDTKKDIPNKTTDIPIEDNNKNELINKYDFKKTKQYSEYSQYMKVLTWNPYFFTQEKVTPSKSNVDIYTNCINYTMYDYLGFNFDIDIHDNVKHIIDEYGTSAGASRLAGGQIPVHDDLEKEIASLYEVESALVYLGGHTTNINAIKALCDNNDLILVDELSHNSILEGAVYSGATRMTFLHNNVNDLEKKLIKTKGKYNKTLIIIEGVYSMDGDIPDLPSFITIKSKYDSILMVDEAHSIGVLGTTGHGIREHYKIDPKSVEMWMGSLGKAFASAGGYIAGSSELIQILKWKSPGFVYSIGIPPPAAATALYSIRKFKKEPERVAKLRDNIRLFQSLCKEANIDIGNCYGVDSAVVPVFVGSMERCIHVLQELRKEGVLVAPGMWPACELNKARLRFFITAVHSPDELRFTVEALKKVLF